MQFDAVKTIQNLFRQTWKHILRKRTMIDEGNRAWVRCVPAESKLKVAVKYTPVNGKAQVFFAERPQDEPVAASLARLSMKVNGANKPKKKRKRQDPEEAAEPTPHADVILSRDDKPIDSSVLARDAWVSDNILLVGDMKYEIVVNMPAVSTLKLPVSIMAGFSTSPKLDVEFADLTHCRFEWYRGSEVSDEYRVGEGPYYSPTNADIGCKLTVVCTPGDGERVGLSKITTSKEEVTAGPGFCPFEKRHILTQKRATGDKFRVVSYNLLADLYADSDFSRTNLFPYCPPYALEISYRKQLLIKELTGYQADVACLQEVDRSVFMRDLLPALEQQGVTGVLKQKRDNVPEGCAIFYRTDRFSVLDHHDITVTTELSTNPQHESLWQTICAKEKLKETMDARSTVLQVMALRCTDRPDSVLIVGCTHLYFHPHAQHVRLMQMYTCLCHLRNVCNIYSQQYKNVAIVFGGDFNSHPDSAAFDLATKGGENPEEQLLKDVTLNTDLDLESAGGTPEYTNYVLTFHGCLDYVFSDTSKLRVDQVIPLPSHEDVVQYTALPNPVFPSDHLAVVCDLQWKDEHKSSRL